jgi:hypothetical protein
MLFYCGSRKFLLYLRLVVFFLFFMIFLKSRLVHAQVLSTRCSIAAVEGFIILTPGKSFQFLMFFF